MEAEDVALLNDTMTRATDVLKQVVEKAQKNLEVEAHRVAVERAQLEKERRALESERKRLAGVARSPSDAIEVNVGGRIFRTTVATLCREAGSMLEALFSGRHHTESDDAGRIFIDRNPVRFSLVLDYLQSIDLTLPRAVLDSRWARSELAEEANFLGLQGLEGLLADAESRDWAVDDLEEEASLSYHQHMVIGMIHDAGVVFVASADKHISSIAADSGVLLGQTPAHDDYVTCLCIHDGHLVSGSRDYTLKLWNKSKPAQLQLLRTVVGHSSFVQAVASYGPLFLSGSQDRTVAVFGDSLQPVVTYSCSEGVKCMTRLGDYVFVGCGYAIEVFALPSSENAVIGQALSAFSIASTNSVAASIDGSLDDFANVPTVPPVFTLQEHNGPIRAICSAEKRNLLVSASWDATVKIWACCADEKQQQQQQRSGGVRDGGGAGGNGCSTVALDGTSLTDFASISRMKCVATLRHQQWVSWVCVLGDSLLVTSSDRSILFWDMSVPTVPCLKTFRTRHEDVVRSLVFLDDRLFTGSFDRTVGLYRRKRRGDGGGHPGQLHDSLGLSSPGTAQQPKQQQQAVDASSIDVEACSRSYIQCSSTVGGDEKQGKPVYEGVLCAKCGGPVLDIPRHETP